MLYASCSAAWLLRLKTSDVKKAVEGILDLAAEETKQSGSFKLAGMLHFRLRVRPATTSKTGVNPFTKKRCIFKAKLATNTVTITTMKKLKDMSNSEEDLKYWLAMYKHWPGHST